MQKVIQHTMGLLREGDYVSLSSDFYIENLHLVDTVTGARHRLSAKTALVLRPLLQGSTIDALFMSGRSVGLHNEQIGSILIFINSIAGLQIRRGRIDSVRHTVSYLKLRLLGVPLATAAKRYRPTLGGLILSVIQTAVPLFLAALAVTIIGFSGGIWSWSGVVLGIEFLMLVLVSCFTHEATHLLLVAQANSPRVIVARGLRIGVLHAQMSNRGELLSALLGPLAGSVASLLIGSILVSINQRAMSIALMVAGFHFLSLIPLYGDGKALFKAFRQLRPIRHWRFAP